jgi:phosphate transport system permease protein
MAALPTLIFTNFGSNIPAQNDRMWAAALTLIVLVLLLNLAGRFVARFSAVRR